MEKKFEELFEFPNILEVPNACIDGSSVKFFVEAVGFIHVDNKVYLHRVLTSVHGIRLELYEAGDLHFIGQFQYLSFYELYADFMRFSSGDLELEFNDDHELIGKIYKYKEE